MISDTPTRRSHIHPVQVALHILFNQVEAVIDGRCNSQLWPFLHCIPVKSAYISAALPELVTIASALLTSGVSTIQWSDYIQPDRAGLTRLASGPGTVDIPRMNIFSDCRHGLSPVS
jgi:hypothetical protein